MDAMDALATLTVSGSPVVLRRATADARRRGCALVQLTSDKRRDAAHRFYARLGFVASHEGFKLQL